MRWSEYPGLRAPGLRAPGLRAPGLRALGLRAFRCQGTAVGGLLCCFGAFFLRWGGVTRASIPPVPLWCRAFVLFSCAISIRDGMVKLRCDEKGRLNCVFRELRSHSVRKCEQPLVVNIEITCCLYFRTWY